MMPIKADNSTDNEYIYLICTVVCMSKHLHINIVVNAKICKSFFVLDL